MNWRKNLNDESFDCTDRPHGGGQDGAFHRAGRESGGEILSADSMQVYRGMDIGSAKIRPEETRGFPIT